MESRLFRFNSRFKLPNESNTDFSIAYHGVNISSIQLLKFSCMKLFPNIFSPYDTLIIDSQIYTIPTAQYTATELAAYITTIGHPCSLVNDKFSFTNAGNVITPTRLSTIILGFPNMQVITPVTSLNTPSMQGPDPIFIESTDIAQGNCLDSAESNSGNIPLVWSIASTPPYGFQISYETNAPEMSQIDIKNNTLSNQTFRLRLTDQFGHTLVLPDNQFTDIIFKVFYES